MKELRNRAPPSLLRITGAGLGPASFIPLAQRQAPSPVEGRQHIEGDKMDERFRRILITGLGMAFCWGAVVALASKIEIKHVIPAEPWITLRN